MNLQNLPSELLLLIFEFLDNPVDRAALRNSDPRFLDFDILDHYLLVEERINGDGPIKFWFDEALVDVQVGNRPFYYTAWEVEGPLRHYRAEYFRRVYG